MQEYTMIPSSRFIISLADYVLENDIDQVRKRLVFSTEEINQKHESGKTPLMLAVQNGNLAIVILLLDYEAATEEINNDDMTALTLAIVHGHETIVRELLARGADPLYAKSYMESNKSTSYHMDRQHLLNLLEDYIKTEDRQNAVKLFFSDTSKPGFFMPNVLEQIVEDYSKPIMHPCKR